jgi:hypothetical protein
MLLVEWSWIDLPLSCKCMKEMNELTELYQRGNEVEESSIDTTTKNIPTTEETNPKNVIVNTNTIDEMVICRFVLHSSLRVLFGI